jgi:hypothetical protein
LGELLDDPQRRDELAARSRGVIERCSLEAMVEPVLAAVDAVTNGGSSRRR